jgi:hypothetical protein
VCEWTIERFWERLAETSSFTFESRCGVGSQTAWEGDAVGRVDVAVKNGIIEFHEQCRFRLKSGGEMDLKNRYRWSLVQEGIELCHFRRGESVHLVTLIAIEDETLIEREGHFCGDDCYRLKIRLMKDGFQALWIITGPKKNETITYRYL